MRFKDANFKIILDFGDNFELSKEYSIAKLVTDTQGNAYTALGMDFSRLTTRSSLYKLTQSGNNFIVTIDTANSEMGTLYKSNIRTMNNFTTISESMIYPHKYKGTNRTKKKRVACGGRKTVGLFGAIASPPPSLSGGGGGVRGWVNPNESSLRGSVNVANTTKQSINDSFDSLDSSLRDLPFYRHTERSEESKSLGVN